MSVRKFLLPVNRPASAEAAVHTGLMLAKKYNAHLSVLHISVDSRNIAPVAGEGLPGAMIEEMMTASEREMTARVSALRAMFEQVAAAEAVTVGRAQRGSFEPSASFTTITGREDEVIAYRARLADLTIVPHPQAGEDVATADALHAVLFDSGRPVLLSPVEPPATIGRRVAIAWNGTANAASALASVMPFVREAEAVCVLTSRDYFRRGPTATDVAEYISHHGVTARILEFHAIDRVTGAGLLAAAAEFGADLMSMGAYSSASRLRQLILGGTTRHVLENAALPVLMNR